MCILHQTFHQIPEIQNSLTNKNRNESMDVITISEWKERQTENVRRMAEGKSGAAGKSEIA